MADQKDDKKPASVGDGLTPIRPNSYELADKSPSLNTFVDDKLGGIKVESFKVDSNRLRATAQINDWLEEMLVPVTLRSLICKLVFNFGLGLLLAEISLLGLPGLAFCLLLGLPVWLLIKLTYGTHLQHISGFHLLTTIAGFLVNLLLALVYFS